MMIGFYDHNCWGILEGSKPLDRTHWSYYCGEHNSLITRQRMSVMHNGYGPSFRLPQNWEFS